MERIVMSYTKEQSAQLIAHINTYPFPRSRTLHVMAALESNYGRNLQKNRPVTSMHPVGPFQFTSATFEGLGYSDVSLRMHYQHSTTAADALLTSNLRVLSRALPNLADHIGKYSASSPLMADTLSYLLHMLPPSGFRYLVHSLLYNTAVPKKFETMYVNNTSSKVSAYKPIVAASTMRSPTAVLVFLDKLIQISAIHKSMGSIVRKAIHTNYTTGNQA